MLLNGVVVLLFHCYTWAHQGGFVPITPVFTMAAMKKVARKKVATKKAAMKKAAMSRLVNVVAYHENIDACIMEQVLQVGRRGSGTR